MMLIGTSLGQCIKDILTGEVSEDDVVMIVTRTMAPTVEKFLGVLEMYYSGYGDSAYDLSVKPLEEVKELGMRLWSAGKIHQPRNFEGYTGGFVHPALGGNKWVEITPRNSNRHPTVVEAYEKYKMLDTLTK